ncbi:sulfurtransferase TusA family protein [Candidatus Magnetaquicoccus inordinatus]|uniref:sulfurtransferase TusA family protein n=1 Tax=Candidatus Magnetaquicoccus inordinatus TaxID=2496818 RepID=UPI00102C5313|nr:sulfurtransferase TusA family protein [Candidatus Magnetaquicoccus inordinatus]
MTESFLDITHEVCPMTFVLVKLRLETLSPGSRLTIRLNGGEPLANIPRSVQEEGWRVESVMEEGPHYTLVVVR